MRRKFIGVAFVALAAVLAGSAHAQDKKVTIGVSIPAADHGWTAGVVYHAERVAKLLMKEHPGLNVIVKTSPDAANQANALQDLAVQGLDALVVLPSDPDPLVNAIKEIKDKGTFVALVDRAPSVNDNSIRDLYVAGNNPALGQVAGEYIKKTTPDAEVVVIRGLPIPIDQQRQDGFDKGIAGSGVKVLDRQYGNWNRDDAFRVMQDYLTKYKKIDVVWCQDDDMAIGVLEAIQQAKRTDIKYIVAGAGSKDMIKKVMDGDKAGAGRCALSAGDGGDRHAADSRSFLRSGAGCRRVYSRRDAHHQGQCQAVLLPGFAVLRIPYVKTPAGRRAFLLVADENHSSAALAKPRRKIIHEAAHLGRQVTAVRIDRIDTAILGNIVVEQGHQLTRLDMRAGDEIRHHGDAEPGAGGAQRCLRAVDLDRPADGDRVRAAIRFEITYGIMKAGIGVDDEGHAGKILWPVERPVFRHEIRRRHRIDPEIGKLAGNEARILQPCNTDRKVEAFFDQIDESVIGDDLQHQFRVFLGEIDEALADIGIDEGARNRNPELALEIGILLAHQICEVVDLLQNVGGGAVIGMSGLGQ